MLNDIEQHKILQPTYSEISLDRLLEYFGKKDKVSDELSYGGKYVQQIAEFFGQGNVKFEICNFGEHLNLQTPYSLCKVTVAEEVWGKLGAGEGITIPPIYLVMCDQRRVEEVMSREIACAIINKETEQYKDIKPLIMNLFHPKILSVDKVRTLTISALKGDRGVIEQITKYADEKALSFIEYPFLEPPKLQIISKHARLRGIYRPTKTTTPNLTDQEVRTYSHSAMLFEKSLVSLPNVLESAARALSAVNVTPIVSKGNLHTSLAHPEFFGGRSTPISKVFEDLIREYLKLVIPKEA